jgi:hypothetical protein
VFRIFIRAGEFIKQKDFGSAVIIWSAVTCHRFAVATLCHRDTVQ